MDNSGNRNDPATATLRLKQDYLRIKKDPVPYVSAEPLPSNILEWHVVVRGPEETPYEGGYYHGKLIFPQEFPFNPPSIYMITPNGKFKCNAKLCLSRSDSPDTWNPTWSVSTILTGLLSFTMESDHAPGSIETSDQMKRLLSAQSLTFNLKDKVFCELFPELVEEIKQKLKEQEESSAPALLLPSPDIVPDADPQHAHEDLPACSGDTFPLGGAHPSLKLTNYQPGLSGAFTTLLVIVGIAVLACLVQYALMTVTQE